MLCCDATKDDNGMKWNVNWSGLLFLRFSNQKQLPCLHKLCDDHIINHICCAAICGLSSFNSCHIFPKDVIFASKASRRHGFFRCKFVNALKTYLPLYLQAILRYWIRHISRPVILHVCCAPHPSYYHDRRAIEENSRHGSSGHIYVARAYTRMY